MLHYFPPTFRTRLPPASAPHSHHLMSLSIAAYPRLRNLKLQHATLWPTRSNSTCQCSTSIGVANEISFSHCLSLSPSFSYISWLAMSDFYSRPSWLLTKILGLLKLPLICFLGPAIMTYELLLHRWLIVEIQVSASNQTSC